MPLIILGLGSMMVVAFYLFLPLITFVYFLGTWDAPSFLLCTWNVSSFLLGATSMKIFIFLKNIILFNWKYENFSHILLLYRFCMLMVMKRY